MDLKSLNADDLVALRIEVEREMHSRDISFSVGEIGEKIAIEFFKSTPGLSNLMAAPPGAKNVDALSRNGDRYSIKTIQRGQKTGTIYFLFAHLIGWDFANLVAAKDIQAGKLPKFYAQKDMHD